MRLSHHPAMIIFPVLLLGVSFLSTWISLLPEGPGRFASVLEILVTAIMLVCLYEPLLHCEARTQKLGHLQTLQLLDNPL